MTFNINILNEQNGSQHEYFTRTVIADLASASYGVVHSGENAWITASCWSGQLSS